VPAVMLAGTWLIPILGFGAGGIVMALGLMVAAQHDAISARVWAVLSVCIALTVTAFVLLFRLVLNVPLPGGLLF